jgi:hypothetical protein
MSRSENINNSEAVKLLKKENLKIMGLISYFNEFVIGLMDSKKDMLTNDEYKNLKELFLFFHNELHKKVETESNLLFDELESQFSSICSTEEMRDDHRKIIALSNFLKIIIEKKSITEFHEYNLVKISRSLYNTFKRHIYLTCDMLFYEMETFLTEEELNKIYSKLLINY